MTTDLVRGGLVIAQSGSAEVMRRRRARQRYPYHTGLRLLEGGRTVGIGAAPWPGPASRSHHRDAQVWRPAWLLARALSPRSRGDEVLDREIDTVVMAGRGCSGAHAATEPGP